MFWSNFDICPFSSAIKAIPWSDKSYCMVISFNEFVFNNLTFRVLEVFDKFCIFFSSFFETFVLYSVFLAPVAR